VYEVAAVIKAVSACDCEKARTQISDKVLANSILIIRAFEKTKRKINFFRYKHATA
jgi:hypothetical protein